MTFEACARIVEKGDPDRFLAAMAAPVEARRVLFPIYAFNVEVARAPWASDEPLIAEMRLQWWVDALEEIADGGKVRRHEVTTPLVDVLDTDNAQMLVRTVDARRQIARRAVFETHDAWMTFLEETSGVLQSVATRALGLSDFEDWSVARGRGLGLANYLLGIPELLRRGQNPLPPMTDAEFSEILRSNISNLSGRAPKDKTPARIVDLATWRASSILKRALADQTAIVEGRLAGSEFGRRAGLFWQSLRL